MKTPEEWTTIVLQRVREPQPENSPPPPEYAKELIAKLVHEIQEDAVAHYLPWR